MFGGSPSSLVLGPVPLSISSSTPGSLWGLSLDREIWSQSEIPKYERQRCCFLPSLSLRLTLKIYIYLGHIKVAPIVRF